MNVTEILIQKSWHHLGVYLTKEWCFLLNQVEQGKLNVDEAQLAMHSQFSSSPMILNQHGTTLQVPSFLPDNLEL